MQVAVLLTGCLLNSLREMMRTKGVAAEKLKKLKDSILGSA